MGIEVRCWPASTSLLYGVRHEETSASGLFLHHLLLEFSDSVTAPPFIAQVWIRMILLSIPEITSGIQIVHLELRLKVLCIVEEVITAARSPWQNPYVARMIGSIRRECLDHLVVLNERQLRRILSEYMPTKLK